MKFLNVNQNLVATKHFQRCQKQDINTRTGSCQRILHNDRWVCYPHCPSFLPFAFPFVFCFGFVHFWFFFSVVSIHIICQMTLLTVFSGKENNKWNLIHIDEKDMCPWAAFRKWLGLAIYAQFSSVHALRPRQFPFRISICVGGVRFLHSLCIFHAFIIYVLAAQTLSDVLDRLL